VRFQPRKSLPAQILADQCEFIKDESAFLEVDAAIKHRRQTNGDDFGVGNFDAQVFRTATHLEKIGNKTVSYKSEISHFRSSSVLSTKQNVGEGFIFSISGIGNLG